MLTDDIAHAPLDGHAKRGIVATLGLSLRALGVIYGDIGTSPLYVLSSIFADSTSTPSDTEIVGVVSCVIWAIFLLVTIKYVIFILMADDHGEGGTFALCSLLMGQKSTLKRGRSIVQLLGIVGAAFVIADGSFTPAVSVLSAIEGLAVGDARLGRSDIILPVTLAIIIALFCVQSFGTSKIGVTFGPIMLLWFAVLAVSGIVNITYAPEIFKAFSPWEALHYLSQNGSTGFLQLGAVFLAVTGLEALYADLGHFGVKPIRISWLIIVMPSLTLNYLGQGSRLIADKSVLANPFYNSFSSKLIWPMIVLSTLATIIASQALISGTFSLVNQAIHLGYFPTVRVYHTSKDMIGQIYIPEVNYALMGLACALVGGFQHSANITQAYGLTVCGVMILTTILYTLVMRYTWRLSLWKVLPFCIFLFLDGVFFAANLSKIAKGGWVSILIGSVISSLMITWYFGQRMEKAFLSNFQKTHEISLSGVDISIDMHHALGEMAFPHDRHSLDLRSIEVSETKVTLPPEVRKTPGIGIYFTGEAEQTPIVFQRMVSRLRAVPDKVVFLSLENTSVPFIQPGDRVVITSPQSDVFRVVIRAGYAETNLRLIDLLNEATKSGFPAFDESYITLYALRTHCVTITRFIPKRIFCTYYSILKRILAPSLPIGISSSLKVPLEELVEIGITIPM